MNCDELFNQYRLLNPFAVDYSHAIFSSRGLNDEILYNSLNRVAVALHLFEALGEEVPGKNDLLILTEGDSAKAILKVKSIEAAIYSTLDKEIRVYGNVNDDELCIIIEFEVIFS